MSQVYSSRNANFYIPFKLAITTTSSPQNFVLPFVSAGKYRCIVDWGDGSSQKVTSSTDSGLTHSYATAGTYEISINGLYTHLDFNVVTTSQSLVAEIRQWGNNFWKRLSFSNCSNMTANYSTGDRPITFQVRDMTNLFRQCSNFNGSVEGWDVTGVTIMQSAFQLANLFNQDLNSWKPSSCQSMLFMFANSPQFNNGGVAFTGPNFGPNMGNVTTMSGMLSGTNFNQPLGNWDVSGCTIFNSVFSGTSVFNQDLNGWNPSSGINMASMLLNCTNFNNGGIAWTGPNFGPNMGNVTDINFMLSGSNFNQPIGNWDVSAVTNMNSLFSSSSVFNQDLNNWSPNSCLTMNLMFNNASAFNNGGVAWTGANFGPNMGNVNSVSSMFVNATSFNQPVGNWDVSGVTNMNSMFSGATNFDQSIGSFDVGSVQTILSVLSNTSLSISNVNDTINQWATLSTTTGVVPFLNVGMSSLTADSGSASGRSILTNDPNFWTFVGLTIV